MEQDKLQELILKHFNKQERQIVFWYDETGENEEKLDSLSLPNIKIHKLTKNNNLLTKKLLEKDDTISNYLIYAPFEMPPIEDNWFIDTQLYSQVLSVDEVDSLCSEFEVYDIAIKNLFKNHIKFFNNKKRINSFKSLLPSNKSVENFYLAMFGTLVECKIFDKYKIIQTFIIKEIVDKNAPSKEFAKYGLEDKFWELIEKEFGYLGEREAKYLLAGIVFKKLQQQLRGSSFPDTYKKYISKNMKEAECNSFLESWYRDTELMPYYKELIEEFERDDFKIDENITDWSDILQSEPEFQTLRAYDRFLVNYLIAQFDSLKDEDKILIEKRKRTLFYNEYENVYNALFWALELSLLVKNTQIPEQKIETFIKSYAQSYYKIDKAYRKFYYYCGLLNDRKLDSVKDKVEKLYVNKYLDDINLKFSNQVKEIAPNWTFSNLPMQKDFYYNEVRSSKNKLVVIISDALRYEIAEELSEAIRSNYSIKADVKLDCMVASIPSYTRLGMASLLPHKEVSMNNKAEIIVDGVVAKDSASREKILQAHNPNSKVLNLSDLEDMSRDDLRALFSGLEIAYIYHDDIDKAGEHNEKDVFNAAEKTVKILSEKIKFLFNNSLCSNVIITADHGFLYQYSDLEEHQKITIGTIDSIECKKRYIIGTSPVEKQGIVDFDMNYIFKNSDLKLSLPCNINRFKTSGAGINYVHGGASPQEIVLPLLRVKQNRKQEIKKVELSLENSSRKITNNKFTLSFLQKESISELVKPRVFSVSLWNEENNMQVSNELIIDANISSDKMEDRIFKKVLELKSFDSDKNKDYYLIIKDVNEVGEPYAKIPFTINLMFQSDF